MTYYVEIRDTAGKLVMFHNLSEQARTSIVEAMKSGTVAVFRDSHEGLHMVNMAHVVRTVVDVA